jgi:hypothetical protein
VGAALSPITNGAFPNAKTNFGQYIGATITRATIGGLASVAGGGKFANGAVTGAFQYLATTRYEGDDWKNALNQAGTLVLPGAAAGGMAGAAAGGVAGLLAGTLTGDTNYGMILYHGTDLNSALALLNGAPLSADLAATLKIDGPQGFYLATNYADAEFFALRRSQPVVLTYDMSDSAVRTLMAGGAVFSPIPGGSKSPFFQGNQFFVPPPLFPTFDQLRSTGQIRVTPTK